MTNADAVTAMPLPRHLTAGRIATSAELRHRHLAEVLWYLRANGPISRHDVAAGCGIAPSTMTDLVQELKSRHLIYELPAVRGRVGRPRQPITIDGSPWCVIGVHLASTSVVMTAVTLGGQEVWHQRAEADTGALAGAALGGRQLGRLLAQKIHALPRGQRVVGVGFALPDGVAGGDTMQPQTVRSSWTRAAVGEWLAATLAEAGVSGAKVAMAGESQFAGLYAARSMLKLPPAQTALYVGGSLSPTGAVITDGQIAPHQGGNVAHLRVVTGDDAVPCWCGRAGCLDTIASLPALLHRAGPQGLVEDPHRAVAWLRAEAQAGNTPVLSALHDAGHALNRSLDAARLMLGPTKVIIGGYLAALNDYLPRLDTDDPQHAAVEYLEPRGLWLGPVRGAALAAQDACLTEPLISTDPSTVTPAPEDPPPGHPASGDHR